MAVAGGILQSLQEAYQSAQVSWQSTTDYINANALPFIILAMVIFAVTAYLLVAQISREMFGLYRKNFYTQVDKGLRDVLVRLEPAQVFAVTMSLAAIAGPVVWLFSNFVFGVVVLTIILISPPLVLQYLRKRRSDQFIQQLPDAMSAMGSSLRSGLNLVKALQQVVKNQPAPLSQEFAQMLVEYRVGQDLNKSLDDLAARINRPDVILMNSAIKISRAVGGNLADTLDILAKTLREKDRVEGKIRALTAMGQSQGRLAALFPLFVGFVLFRIEPFTMNLLFTTKLGYIWLAAMVTMGVLGIFFINKVVTVDV